MSGLFEDMATLVSTSFKNVFWYITQKRCKRAVEDNLETLGFVPDHLKTSRMCERVFEDYPATLEFVPNYLKT